MGFTLSWRCIFIIDLVFILIGIATFMKGFFPLKRHLPGYAEAGNEDNSSTIKLKLISQITHYDKIVIVLIDALRADFVLNHSTPMKYVQTMMDRGKTLSYIVKANPPTVTLPRIKALTTGSIPGFIDVVMNFDSAALMEDNIITQMKRAGKRILFYGDDTWITLFPNHFVDHNVSRHLNFELQRLDWDVMILHYLGLDHIGHLAGPKSPLVKPKLQEMDDVIQKIYNALEKETTISSLILICGDHGMSDQGSHGGASVSEVTVPAVFLSPSFSNIPESSQGEIIQQIDLPPTLSVLLGIPIPKNNLGSVVTSTLIGYSKEEVLWFLYSNAEQIVKLFEANFENYDTDGSFEMYRLAVQEHSDWLDVMKSHGDSPVVDEKSRSIAYRYKLVIQSMTARISSSLTMYDMYSMITAVILLWLVLIKSSLAKVKRLPRNEGLQISRHSVSLMMVSIPLVGFCHVTVCTSHFHAESFLCGASQGSILLQLTIFVGLIFQVVVSLSIVLCSFHKLGAKKNSFCWSLFIGTVCHTLSLLSSSFVEEEHQTWYFLTMTFHILLLAKIFTTKMLQKAKRSANETSGEENTENYSKLSQHESHDNCSSYFHQENSGVNFHERKFQTCHKPSPDIRQFVNSPNEKEEKKYDEKERKKDDSLHSKYADPLCSTWNAVLGVLAVLILSRALRSLNQTGNKWLDRPDVGDWLTKPENKVWLSVTVIISLVTLLASICGVLSWLDRTLLLIGCFGVYRYRANTGDLIFFETPSSKASTEAWLVYAVIFIYFIKSLKSSFKLSSMISSLTSVGSKTPPSQFSIQSPDKLHCLHSHCKLDCIQSVENISSLQLQSTQQPILVTSLSLQNSGTLHTLQDHGRLQPKFRIPESPQILVAPCSQQNTGSLQVIHNCWILLMTLLMRPHNVAFVAMVTVQEILVERYLLGHMTLSTSYLTLYCLWMGEASFFYQGNSNSISTVDVSAGYVGLMVYQPVLVGMLLSLATYAGPIFWLLALVKYVHAQASCPTASLQENKARFGKEFTKVVHTLILTRALPLAAYTVLVTAQRYHLFVWTVFSPKLLYEGMFTVVIVVFSLVVLLICQ
ncbi:hypothetical protein CHS0354_026476 [Potamilus streckersoni]|uniref:GPI ethanolamine phosphate transferase 2 C-terminal domain-containing protein n=1 Tax=Potamilus streckersoni TaxID=2493646 RepID=A0AAE0RQ91_9BIVA|nr:hypothetical protein CHS0354_026476 [Potamilus streckersoni]